MTKLSLKNTIEKKCVFLNYCPNIQTESCFKIRIQSRLAFKDARCKPCDYLLYFELSDDRSELLHPKGGRSKATRFQDFLFANVSDVKTKTSFLKQYNNKDSTNFLYFISTKIVLEVLKINVILFGLRVNRKRSWDSGPARFSFTQQTNSAAEHLDADSVFFSLIGSCEP